MVEILDRAKQVEPASADEEQKRGAQVVALARLKRLSERQRQFEIESGPEYSDQDDDDDEDEDEEDDGQAERQNEDEDDDLYEMPNDQLPEEFQGDQPIDFELIDSVREKLKIEYEANSELYSEPHYLDIMSEYCPQVCWRYLLHCDRQLEQTLELMRAALAWRLEAQVDQLSPTQMCKEFWHMTPIIKCGLDRQGNSTFCIMGKNYRKPDAILKQMIKDFCSLVLFKWDEVNKDNMRKLTIIFDVTDTGYRNMDLDFMSWLVGIRDFLPTRFSRIYVIGIPFLIRPIVRLIIGWLPANFRSIVHCGSYEQLVAANIDSDQLPEECGGTSTERNRLAPVEAPWMSESKIFQDPKVRKAIEETIGFSVSQEQRDLLRKYQIEHELELQQSQSAANKLSS